MRTAFVIALGLAALVGCGADSPTEYTAQTRADFMTACVDPVTDSERTINLCECVYRNARATIPYDDMVAYSEQLTVDAETSLPPALVTVMVDCIEDEVDL